MIYLVVIQLLLTGHCVHSPIVFAEDKAVASETPHKVFFIRLIQVAVHTPRGRLVGVVVDVRAYLACVCLQSILAMSSIYSTRSTTLLTCFSHMLLCCLCWHTCHPILQQKHYLCSVEVLTEGGV